MTPSRLRFLSLVTFIALAAIVILAWSQTWFTMRLSTSSFNGSPNLVIGGSVAGGALLPVALASFAVVAALALAGTVFRVILALLESMLGISVIVVSLFSLSDPVTAGAPTISASTGISGPDSLHDLVIATQATPWPFVGVVVGILMVIAGLGVAATARTWPVSGRKYSRTRAAEDTPSDERADDRPGDAIHDWDALSEGDDPTASGQ
ncbi:hypothetical protein BH11ACT3_BH11ACT3_16570 [soil metagenome]